MLRLIRILERGGSRLRQSVGQSRLRGSLSEWQSKVRTAQPEHPPQRIDRIEST